MNIKELENKTILIFGKSRAFSESEFKLQMKLHKINLVREFNEEVVLSVDGRMMTPYEVNESTRLYEEKLKSISIDALDKILCEFIDEDTLFMSLKLSHDKKRLKGYLQNSMISDELFLKILKLYSWESKDFFETDDNRDVSAAFINRFYKDIERNHNVQYASTGFHHLILQTNNENLVETIASLEPLQRSFQTDLKDNNFKIITAIITHAKASRYLLKRVLKNSSSYVRTLIAMRDDCDLSMQTELFETKNEDVVLALSHNANLDMSLALKLMQNEIYKTNIAKHINLNNDFFDILFGDFSLDLAQNETLNFDMQKKLFNINDMEVLMVLSQNIHLHKDIFDELILIKSEKIELVLYKNSSIKKELLINAYESEKYHISLANNKNTPKDILQKLSLSKDVDVLLGLAKNENTPIDILYQLQLDSRFERSVKENSAFGVHIQTQNIGWRN